MMIQHFIYRTPLGFPDLMIGTEYDTICTIRFCRSIDTAKADDTVESRGLPKCAHIWLDHYFCGIDPGDIPPLCLRGLTAFQLEVAHILLTIPYGCTRSYGEIANQLARKKGIPKMSAQAVGMAAHANPIGIMVPCHRVISSDGSIGGYAAGGDIKIALLEREGLIIKHLYPSNKSKVLGRV